MALTEFHALRNEKGTVLIIALLALLLLTIIGISAITSTTTDIQIASNEKAHNMAFYAADAGIEVGRAVLNALKNDDGGNWDNLLAGQQLVGQAAGTTTLDQVIASGGGNQVGPATCTFNLQVRDNNDLDGDHQVDTDSMIVLTSTGRCVRAPDRVTQVQIETQLFYSGAGDQYAQEYPGNDSSGEAAPETEAVVGNVRW